MNPTWLNFLQNQRAVIENDHVLNYGDTTVELKHTKNGTVIVDLSHFGLIQFSGEDAQDFLQGQLTCNLKKINPDIAQYGGYCTPKGRLLATFLLWKNENYLMQLPASLCAAIQKRLSLFVLRAKVQLADNSDSLIRIGMAGKNARMLAEEISGTKFDPERQLAVAHNELTTILCQAPNRYEFVTNIKYAPTLWAHLRKHAIPAGAACWDWLEIQSGIPVILPATQEQFIPQMVNLDAIEGVSFQKGCYPGQEIVARTHYLGKIKRRMYLANISTTASVTAGDELFSVVMTEQSCGKIVNTAPSPSGGYDVLAVIQISSVEAGKVHWKTLDGPVLEINLPPYSLLLD
jgi:folate-binding protein YgfZ